MAGVTHPIFLAFLFVGSINSLALPQPRDGNPRFTKITVTNGGQWGSWYTLEFCPDNSKAVGFELKVEREQDRGDDTALNGVRLYCVDTDTDPFHVTGTITSVEGGYAGVI